MVYRGGDAISGWVKRGLDLFADHPATAMLIGAAVAILWAGVGAGLGRKQSQIEAHDEESSFMSVGSTGVHGV